MAKRQLILNGYKTAEDGLFTLASLKITKADQVQTFVSVPGRFAPLDLSTALTDGEPYYGNARLEAVLESSEGTREERQQRIDEMVNQLDGYQARIIHPDRPGLYMIGRLQVQPNYNDLVHCAVSLTAVCEPWFYSEEEVAVTVDLGSGSTTTAALLNRGRMRVVPVLTISPDSSGTNPSINVRYDNSSISLSPGKDQTTGTFTLPWLQIPANDSIVVNLSGNGIAAFTYREAVLAE